jgi:hypothetical protein
MLLRKKGMVDMQNMLAQFCMNQLGFGPLGEIHMLTPGSGNAHNYFRDKVDSANLHHFVSYGEAALVTQRNDILLVTPGSHPWRGDAHATAAALTWDKESTHMLGMDAGALTGYSRARFSHAGYAMANFMTVSGASNCFKNLRWMHGSSTGGASDLTCAIISGSGNKFENVCFATPLDATQAATTGYLGVRVSGSLNHFKNCMFGSTNDIDRSAANALLSFDADCGPWNVFENCIFRSRSGGGQSTAYFINDKATSTIVDFTAIFLNCQFLHQGTALAVAITKAANASRKLYFDSLCSFAGVTDLIADARVAEVWSGGAGGVEAATDFKQLNKAHILVAT